MVRKRIICIGDPIVDIYVGGKVGYNDFVSKDVEILSGGMLNTYKNLTQLLKEYKNYVYILPSQDTIYGDIFTTYTIVRTPIHKKGFALSPYETRKTFYEPTNIVDGILNLYRPPCALLLADYNKGTLNTTEEDIDKLPEFEYCVVDTRYRSLDLKWIQTSKVKIWRATGDEYTEEYAKNFDYVIRSDGQEPVNIIHVKEKVEVRLSIPKNTLVKETCGAGDVFTASIAAHLSLTNKIDLTTLVTASEFAIEACQDAITRPYTSVTNLTCTI